MELLLIFFFFIYAFIIFWAMVGYPVSIRIISKLIGSPKIKKDYNYEPTVTLMIVAHNEEKVIRQKLVNVSKLDYPKDKLEILVSSDNSTDDTNKIVQEFITEYPNMNVRLYLVKERKGKTNAQNKAAQTVSNEMLIMTDANAKLDKMAVKEIVSVFNSENIAYVTGRLEYINSDHCWTSSSEASYWEWDLRMREVESYLHSVTAGNGALYACRTSEYHHFNLVKSHDGAMPKYYVLQGKRAIYNKDAIAYEKAGEKAEDEFKRKVRMSRSILSMFFVDIRLFNFFKYGWFSYCFFGHRYCRQNLWFAHLMVFILSAILAFHNLFFLVIFLFQIAFYALALIRHSRDINNKVLNMVYYYTITILAQLIGAYRQLTGKSKPFWEKAESTR